MPSADALIALSLLPALVGAALLLVGLRGRRVDGHPLCRRCGFDLVRLPRTSAVCTVDGSEDHQRVIEAKEEGDPKSGSPSD